ncbi:MAG: preprotein translocase subunit YajC [Nitrosomonas sp.]|nr:preprotein translocase subunit YajC [Nitrosomonas sp.]MBK7365265.1 preprotein translocase subunit YajC [Nitrosomonas sp.]
MLISEAFAQAASGSQTEPGLMSFLPLIGILIIFYLLLIRPQSKRAKEQIKMRDTLQKGDEVIISGGELGRVVSVGDNYVTLEIAPSVEIVVVKSGVQTLLPKGTLKSIDTGKSNKLTKNNKAQKVTDTTESDAANKGSEDADKEAPSESNKKES